jgi:predicted CoA-binding protein
MGADAVTVCRMLACKRIAVVGVSDDPSRPSHRIAQYLAQAGYEVFPVNPNLEQVLGRRCYPDPASVETPIELVNVFRLPKFCPDVTRAAIAAGARGVWLQSGIISAESAALAEAAGIDFVQDRCIMIEHLHFNAAE